MARGPGLAIDPDRGPETAGAPPGGSALLDAVVALASNLDLDEVLHRIVESARQLTGAPYAALGVLTQPSEAPESRHLGRFHQSGVPAEQADRIGATPHGRGVLGVLIDDPRPLRLDEIVRHPAFEGFPPDHPHLSTFLGVPIRVRGTVFGNLYLADKQPAFTEADEEIVQGLAAAAGVAIQNARLFAEAQRQQAWLAATARAGATITTGRARVADQIAELARDAGDCQNVAVCLPTGFAGEEGLVRGSADGCQITGTAGPAAARLRGVTVSSRAPAEQREPADDSGLFAQLPGHRAEVWLRVGDETLGLVALHRTEGDFTEPELDAMQTFADQVALATDRVRNEHNRHRLAVFADRDRIARDLHDHVIQRIFAVGLGLQGVLRRVPDEDPRARLEAAIDDLDATITEIRTTIFSLHHAGGPAPRSLRADLLGVISDAARVLGFEPQVTLVGPIDLAVPDSLNDDVLATLRESLANVVRHAAASEVGVTVRVDVAAKTLTVQVEDNGVGIAPGTAPRGGLRTTEARAATAGGHATVVRRSPAGTSITWVVPLPV